MFKIEETVDRSVIATPLKGDKLSKSPSHTFDSANKQWYHLDLSIDSDESTISKLSTGSVYHPTSHTIESSSVELEKNIRSLMPMDKKKSLISPSAKITAHTLYFPPPSLLAAIAATAKVNGQTASSPLEG